MDQIAILNQLRNAFAKDVVEHYSGKILGATVLNALSDADREAFVATADEQKRDAFFGSFVDGVGALSVDNPSSFMEKAVSAIKPFADAIAQNQLDKAVVTFEDGTLGETLPEVVEGAKDEFFNLEKMEENEENATAFEDLRSYMKHVLSIESDEVVEQIVQDVKDDIDEAKKKKEIIQTAVNEIKEAKDDADEELKEQTDGLEEDAPAPAAGDPPPVDDPANTPPAPAKGDTPPADGEGSTETPSAETSTEGLSFEQALDIWIPKSPRKFRDTNLGNESLNAMKRDFRRAGGGSSEELNQRLADLGHAIGMENDESTKTKFASFTGKIREAVSSANVEAAGLFRLGITNNSIIRNRSMESIFIAKEISKRFVLKKKQPAVTPTYSAENWNGMIEGAFDLIQLKLADRKKPSAALREEIYSRESALFTEMKKLDDNAKSTLRTIFSLESMIEIGSFGKPFVQATREAVLVDKKEFNPQDIYGSLFDGAAGKLEEQFGRKLNTEEGTVLQNALRGDNAIVNPTRYEQIALKIGESAISNEGLELSDEIRGSIMTKARTFTTISYALERLGVGNQHQKTLMNLIR